MILIFDTYGGLCNQMYDIQSAINYCAIYNIQFSFRNASLREKHDLTKWYNIPFNQLFHDSFIETKLYIPFENIELNMNNTHMYNSDLRCIEWIDKERALLPQLYRINKEYIILKQFWAICPPLNEIINCYETVKPCKKIRQIFKEIKQTLPDQYNYIHYRYEDDFIHHFQITNHPKLCNLIETTQFINNDLKIYVAAYNITNIKREYLSRPITSFDNVIYKKKELGQLNFEELAFIDFLIGKNAIQIYGHKNSSFSVLLNATHNSNNYY